MIAFAYLVRSYMSWPALHGKILQTGVKWDDEGSGKAPAEENLEGYPARVGTYAHGNYTIRALYPNSALTTARAWTVNGV